LQTGRKVNYSYSIYVSDYRPFIVMQRTTLGELTIYIELEVIVVLRNVRREEMVK
jgi:hypothetical protein